MIASHPVVSPKTERTTLLYTCPDHPQAKVRKETEYIYYGQRGKLKRPKVVSERYFCYECGRELGGRDEPASE